MFQETFQEGDRLCSFHCLTHKIYVISNSVSITEKLSLCMYSILYYSHTAQRVGKITALFPLKLFTAYWLFCPDSKVRSVEGSRCVLHYRYFGCKIIFWDTALWDSSRHYQPE